MNHHPEVPTSDQPPKPEWTGHYWYTLRAFALQANRSTSNQLQLVFRHFATAIPCKKCKEHYAAYEPAFGQREGVDPRRALEWIQTLRAAIQRRVDIEASEAIPDSPVRPPPTKYRSALPKPAVAVYGSTHIQSNHSPQAIQRQQAAIDAALNTTPPSTQIDALVPSSKRPSSCEWMPHVWYTLRGAALQARPELTLLECENLKILFKNLDAVLPCSDACRKAYVRFYETAPFGDEQALDPVKAMKWLEQVRTALHEELQDGLSPSKAPMAPKAGRPRMPSSVFGPCLVGSNDTIENESQIRKAIQQALVATENNHKKGDCGCSAKMKEIQRPSF